MKSLILIPSPIECEYLLFDGAEEVVGTPFKVWQEHHRYWAICGIGAAAAAMSTTWLTSRFQPDQVILAGIAGAFQQSQCKLTDVVQVSSDRMADLGYETNQQLMGLDQMGLPLWQGQETTLGSHFELPLWDKQAPASQAITVNRITASEARAEQLWTQFATDLEQMEGAGVALACEMLQVPCFHLRAISNYVGPRDPQAWCIEEACAALKTWLKDRL